MVRALFSGNFYNYSKTILFRLLDGLCCYPTLELPYKVILMMESQHTFSWKNKIKLFLNCHQNSWYSRAQVGFKF